MTRIEEAQEQLLAYRKAPPPDLGAATQWVETHDGIEQKISHLKAETLGDVLIKLDSYVIGWSKPVFVRVI